MTAADREGPRPEFLELDDVGVEFSSSGGSVVALDGVSMRVGDGETVAVIGPSGCGKSTLLRAIAGLERSHGGTIRFRGQDLAGIAPHRRGMGLMFQDHVLFPHLDVAGNVAYGLTVSSARRRRRGVDPRRRVDELLELVGLKGFADRPVAALSGGESQRVALARSLAPRPSLLLLDEPLGALDRVLREQLTADLRRLLSSLGQSAIHVTHDQQEAFALADRIVVLNEGRVCQVGTPEAVWSDPASVFVAEFVGHRNIWSVEVGNARVVLDGRGARSGNAGDPADEAGAIVITGGATSPWRQRLGPGRHRVVLPEHRVRVCTPEAGSVVGTVVRTAFRGADHAVEISAPIGTVHGSSAVRAQPGARIGVGFDPGDLIVIAS